MLTEFRNNVWENRVQLDLLLISFSLQKQKQKTQLLFNFLECLEKLLKLSIKIRKKCLKT